MAVLHVLYDPSEKIVQDAEMNQHLKIRHATLSVPDELEGRDIYEIARKLAELLLEQI